MGLEMSPPGQPEYNWAARLLLVSNSVTINPYMARQGAAPAPGLNFYPTVSVPLLQIPGV